MCSVSFEIAPSKPSPASTLTAIRSSASGSSARIRSLRERALPETDEVGGDEADPAQRDRGEEQTTAARQRRRRRAARVSSPPSAECRLEGEERRRRDRPAEAGREQPRADAVDRRLRVELQRPACEPVAERREHALAERQLLLAERGAELVRRSRRA